MDRFDIGRRAFLGMACGLVVTSMLTGCGRRFDGRLRYRMTVEVWTPQGLRTGSGVVEVRVGSWVRGLIPRVRGQAIPVDLPGGQTIYAVLSKPNNADFANHLPYLVFTDRMPDLIGPFGARNSRDFVYEQIHSRRPVAILEGDELPMLVRFRNPADPRSVEMVSPHGRISPGVRLSRIWIAITDDDVTTGIERRLPWLPNHGGTLGQDRRLHTEAPEKDLTERAFSQRLL